MFHFLFIASVFAIMPLSISANHDAVGSSSRQAKQDAIATIPYQQLNPPTQRKINTVVSDSSIYRRLPLTSINIDPDYLVFLVRHPEVVVNIWKLMGVTNMESDRTGPFTIESNDGSGTISNMELVYGTKNLHVFYGTGSYEGQIIKRKLTGKCVLILKTDYTQGANGMPVAINRLDVFLKLDNSTVGFVAKTLNPLVGPTADHNFVESLKFLQRLNETTEQNGPGVQRMANRLTDVQPQIRRDYAAVSGLVYQRARQLGAERATQAAPVTAPASQNYQYQQGITPLNSPQTYYPSPRSSFTQNGYASLMRQMPIYPPQSSQPNYQHEVPITPMHQMHQGSYRWSQGTPQRRAHYQAPQYPAQNYYRR